MLVLGRKIGESIVVPNSELTITVVKVHGNRVTLGIEAPKSVPVYRKEVWQRSLISNDIAQNT